MAPSRRTRWDRWLGLGSVSGAYSSPSATDAAADTATVAICAIADLIADPAPPCCPPTTEPPCACACPPCAARFVKIPFAASAALPFTSSKSVRRWPWWRRGCGEKVLVLATSAPSATLRLAPWRLRPSELGGGPGVRAAAAASVEKMALPAAERIAERDSATADPAPCARRAVAGASRG